jgi:serine/threonine protein kinase
MSPEDTGCRKHDSRFQDLSRPDNLVDRNYQAGPRQAISSPSAVYLNPLRPPSTRDISAKESRLLAIRWLEEVNHQGASSTVYKVEIAFDPLSDCVAEPNIFAVKALKASNLFYFSQEVSLFAQMANDCPRPAIVDCYGTFEHRDDEGQLTHNFLLEHAQGDLWQYWKDTTPPKTNTDLAAMYSEFCKILTAVQFVHSLNGDRDQGQRFRHGDIKPGNLLRFTRVPKALGTLKLADFGTCVLERSHDLSYIDCCYGGTRAYSGSS